MDIHNCYAIDFETTDVDPKKCEPIEFACVHFTGGFDLFIRPNNPIPPETSAIHHITDEDVANAPGWDIQKQLLIDFFTASPGSALPILVAHNAEYERTIIGEFPPVLWVCTYKCALRIWPEAPGHKNEVLRYWLKLGTNRGRSNNQHPHSALHDCQVTFLILQELLKHATLEQLVEWTELPAKLPHMPMGKHYKQKWEEIPGPYLQWCINQQDMREDVKYCAREELQRRRGATQRSH
jgi:exodeoxyribonuclease X